MRKWQQFVCVLKLLLSVYSPLALVCSRERIEIPQISGLCEFERSFTVGTHGSAVWRVVYCFVSSYKSKWHIWKIAVRWKQRCITFDICSTVLSRRTNRIFRPNPETRCSSQKLKHIAFNTRNEPIYASGNFFLFSFIFSRKCLLCIRLQASWVTEYRYSFASIEFVISCYLNGH